jgi:hypothetical protein
MSKGRAEKVAVTRIAKSRAFASAGSSLRISAQEFIAWQEELGLSNAQAAAALYIGPNTVTALRADGGGAEIGLKCRAVAAGISAADPWPDVWRLGRVNEALRVTA